MNLYMRKKALCPINSQCGDVVCFQFLQFFSSVSWVSEYAPCSLVKVLCVPEGWWLRAHVCCISGARMQESIYYMLSVYNLLGWKSLSQPAIGNRTPSLHKLSLFNILNSGAVLHCSLRQTVYKYKFLSKGTNIIDKILNIFSFAKYKHMNFIPSCYQPNIFHPAKIFSCSGGCFGSICLCKEILQSGYT